MQKVDVITLTNREYCFIKNPFIDGATQFGVKIQMKGEKQFFLQPGEELLAKKQVTVLGEDEALLLKALSKVTIDGKVREAGTKWMIEGPCEYFAPIEVTIDEKRKLLPLDENEGIYVRDKNSGEVNLVSGPQTYMLASHE